MKDLRTLRDIYEVFATSPDTLPWHIAGLVMTFVIWLIHMRRRYDDDGLNVPNTSAEILIFCLVCVAMHVLSFFIWGIWIR